MEDVLIACTDNLTGFAAAIEVVFPQTDIQNCIIHPLRNSNKYISDKALKALMADLKKVYTAVDEASGMTSLGQKVPQDFPIMAGKLDESEHILQIPIRTEKVDLYDQHH